MSGQSSLLETQALLDGKRVTIIEYVRVYGPRGWCVRCQKCTYSKTNLGGQLEASALATTHMLRRGHDVVSWNVGQEGTRTLHEYRGPDKTSDPAEPPF